MRGVLKTVLLAMTLCTVSSAYGAAPTEGGKQVFDHWCAICHAAAPRMPGTAALAAKYGSELPAALEERKDLTPEVVEYFVRHGVSVMPRFRQTEITDAELATLADYLTHNSADSKK